MEKIKNINKIVSIVCFSVVLVSLVWFLIVFKNLPDSVGVHFGPDGNFDVFAKKGDFGYVFYNYIVSIVYLVIFELGNFGFVKLKTGLNMNEKQENNFRFVIMTIFNLFKILIVIFYCIMWAYSVGSQSPLNTNIVVKLFALYGLLFLFTAGYVIYIVTRFAIIPKLIKKQ